MFFSAFVCAVAGGGVLGGYCARAVARRAGASHDMIMGVGVLGALVGAAVADDGVTWAFETIQEQKRNRRQERDVRRRDGSL